jgi:hypothetical protein
MLPNFLFLLCRVQLIINKGSQDSSSLLLKELPFITSSFGGPQREKAYLGTKREIKDKRLFQDRSNKRISRFLNYSLLPSRW